MSATSTGGIGPGDVLLVQTHLWSPATFVRVSRIFRELAGHTPCRLLLQDDSGPVRKAWTDAFLAEGWLSQIIFFDPVELLDRYLPGQGRPASIVPGYAHLPLLDFSAANPFRRYWLIESDVEYTGCWRDLLDAANCDEADLLATHVLTRLQRPRWYWWKSLRNPSGLAPVQALKAFLPVYRISRRGLAALRDRSQRGWKGHFECLVPTVLARAGMVVRDLRSCGDCYDGVEQDPYAPPGQLSTMRWRPNVSPAELTSPRNGPKLFHPVKEEIYFDRSSEPVVTQRA